MTTKELKKHIKHLEAILQGLEPTGFVYETLKIQLKLYKQELKKWNCWLYPTDFLLVIFYNLGMITEVIGANINQKRKELKLSQEELAFRAKMDRSYLAEVEKGKVNISVLKLEQIAKALEVNVDELLKWMSPIKMIKNFL